MKWVTSKYDGSSVLGEVSHPIQISSIIRETSAVTRFRQFKPKCYLTRLLFNENIHKIHRGLWETQSHSENSWDTLQHKT